MSFGNAASEVWCPVNKPERLYVECEIWGSALGPELGDLGGRHGVVAAVHFDQRKLCGIKAEAVLWRVALGWVEPAGRDQALVGP